MVLEGKKQLDSCNVKPAHTRNIQIGNHKGSIVAEDLELSPPGCCMYSLPSHAMDATDITRSMEDSYGRCIDVDIGVEVKLFSRLKFYMMLKEFLNKCFEVWYFDVLCNIRQ